MTPRLDRPCDCAKPKPSPSSRPKIRAEGLRPKAAPK